jgi:ubiquinone biosynthesis UbiH/UbiF/VisC/COQ6 family hydroxylase
MNLHTAASDNLLVHDVAIIGGGLVGASLALALHAAGLQVVLVDPQPVAAAAAPETWDSRIYAVSPGNAAFLESLGVWPRLDQRRLQRVESMAICGDRREGRLEFTAYDAGLRELAWIVESGALQRAMSGLIGEASGIRRCTGQAAGLTLTGSAAQIALTDGSRLDAQLVVGTDGRDSMVRREAGIELRVNDYHQSGVVANFEAQLPHHGTAFQWFRADGILALLPLPGNRVSMVWSTPEEHARTLLALDDFSLEQCVGEAAGAVLGQLRLITPAAAFPLRLAQAGRLAAFRVALAGDAAHNVHPLAGQGVNLGFRDVRVLAGVLASRAPRQDCGEPGLLRRYERARREDIATMAYSTDALQKLFGSRSVWLSGVRNFGLGALNHLPVLKNLLIQHAAA